MRILLFLILALSSTTLFSQVDLKAGLMLHYTFDGVIKDESGNQNDPVDNKKTSFTEDRFGKAAGACHFNGKNSYLRIADNKSIRMDDQISLCVWIRPTGFYSNKCHVNSIIMKGKQTGTTFYSLRYDDNIYRNNGNCNAKLDKDHENFSGNGTNNPAYEPYVQLNKWQNVIYTFDGTTARIYIDGKEVKTEEGRSLYFTNPQDLFIGKVDLDSYPYWLNADLDDLRIYDRAITQAEVTAIAEAK